MSARHHRARRHVHDPRPRRAPRGLAGMKGFGGGFQAACGSAFGEHEMKAFVATPGRSPTARDRPPAGSTPACGLALTHYVPIADTLAGERREIYPFLGNDLLGEAVDAAGARPGGARPRAPWDPHGMTPRGHPCATSPNPCCAALTRCCASTRPDWRRMRRRRRRDPDRSWSAAAPGRAGGAHERRDGDERAVEQVGADQLLQREADAGIGGLAAGDGVGHGEGDAALQLAQRCPGRGRRRSTRRRPRSGRSRRRGCRRRRW